MSHPYERCAIRPKAVQSDDGTVRAKGQKAESTLVRQEGVDVGHIARDTGFSHPRSVFCPNNRQTRLSAQCRSKGRPVRGDGFWVIPNVRPEIRLRKDSGTDAAGTRTQTPARSTKGTGGCA